ncbi:MAG: HAD family hydrolase [Propionibacteriaceae bacterium]
MTFSAAVATANSFPFQGVMWDFDGTLVDTEPQWMQSELMVLSQLGISDIPEGFQQQLVGQTLLHSAKMMLTLVPDATISAAELVDILVAEQRRRLAAVATIWRPGAYELMTALAHAGVPQAIVSMSYRCLLDVVVDHLPINTFQALVSGDDVRHGKPHPEPFLLGAQRLGVDPTACVVFEDSGPGAASGNAAGCFVVAVPCIVTPPQAPRRIICDTLEGFTPETLTELWRCYA